MPVTPSAKKSLRNSEAKRDRNSVIKDQLKRILKGATAANLSEVFSFVDKAAKREIIHPNKAARLKARLSKSAANPDAPKAAPTRKAKKTVKTSKAKQAKAKK